MARTKGTRQLGVEVSESLLDEFKAFCEKRGEKVRHHLELAIRRHLDNPPLPLVPPPPPVLPAPALTSPLPPITVPDSKQPASTLNTPLREMKLSVRTRGKLSRAGIATVGELAQRTADDLLDLKQFGMTGLTEVRERLAKLGLHLKGD
ncbi:MAG: hypothetical protein K8U57_23065 [Planctomycetes bacterium]|nr:hypothetical protein [Planctomycetota bacterium]